MERRTVGAVLGIVGFATMLPTLSSAGTIRIRSNDVIPVVFEEDISLKNNHRGDHISARVKDDRDLPRGATLVGRIVDLHRRHDKNPAYADLEFIAVVMPDGTRTDIRALPVTLNDRNVRRTRDGRLEGTKSAIRKEDLVMGSTAGGLILGSLIRKPFEGAFIGALAGVVLAETNALNTDGDMIVKKGASVGALFVRDADIDTGRYDDYGRRGDSRNDDYRDGDSRRDDDRYNRDRDYDRNRDDRYDNSRDFRIAYDGRDLRFDRDEKPYRSGNTVMVPLEATARQLGLDVRDDGRGAYTIEDNNSSLKIEQDSRNYRLNGRRGTLARAAIEKSGVVYVPIEILAAIKDRPVTLNGTRL